eukprot:5533668-Alexandrium_andersonii.AAC.1
MQEDDSAEITKVRGRVDQALGPHAGLAALLRPLQITRGSAGGLPAIVPDEDAARCCMMDALGQVTMDWQRAAASRQRAERVVALTKVARAS